MKKAVVLISGGADSATVLAMMQEMSYEIYAMSFNYSQRNNVELEKAKLLAKIYNVKEHKIVNINLRDFGGSALTTDIIDVPKYTHHDDLQDNIPVTYVPARNTIFLSYALGFAEIIGAYDIFIGVHATDYANYPDCRPEYIEAFEKLANIATEAGIKGRKISIHAPLISMSKSDIIAKGIELNVDYSSTISCYDPSIDGKSCSKCHACLIRLDAFKKNNLMDPIDYQSLSKILVE